MHGRIDRDGELDDCWDSATVWIHEMDDVCHGDERFQGFDDVDGAFELFLCREMNLRWGGYRFAENGELLYIEIGKRLFNVLKVH